jgi:hypothetical protein
MLAASRQTIPIVVQQHTEDAAILRDTRSVLNILALVGDQWNLAT